MDDDEVAMEFAADVEEAVASVRDLAASAQELADTAKEAQDGVAGIAAPAADAGAAVGEVASSAGEASTACGELGTAARDAATGVESLGASATEAATGVSAAAAAQERFTATQKAQADAYAQLTELQRSGTASTEELTAATNALTDASVQAASARKDLATMTATASDEQAAAGLKTDAASASLTGLKAAGLAAAVGVGVATDEAVKFNAETTRLVTSAGEQASNLNLVRQGMLSVASTTDTSTEQMAAGMYTIESAGYHGAQGLVVLKAAAQGAKDENAELATVSNAVTDALIDFHEPAADAADVTSQLIAGVAHGKTNFEEYSTALSNVLPLAGSLHLKLADVSGVLAEMTAHGFSAQRASEDEANAMRSLMNPTATMSAEYAKLGITSRQVQDSLGTRGLGGTMQWLSGIAQSGATGIGQTYTQAMAKAMGTAPGLIVALATTGENANATNAAIQGISSATADANGNVAGFSDVSAQASFKLGAAAESAKAAGISLGEVFVPAVTDALGPITSFLQLIASNRAASIAFALVVGTILATAVGVKLAGALKDAKEGVQVVGEGIEWLAAKMGLATEATEAQTVATEAATVAQSELDVAEDANPIGLIILAVAALIAIIVLLITHWHEVAHVFDLVRHDIAAGVDWLVSFVKGHWELLVEILTGTVLIALVAKYWSDIEHAVMTPVNAVLNWVKANWKEIVGWLVDPLGMAVHEILTHTHQIAQEFDGLRHDVASILDGARHDIASAWDGARHDAAAAVDGLRHDIASGFDQQRHDVAAFADWLPTEIEHGFDIARHDAAAAFDALVKDVESAFDDARHNTAAGVDDIVSFFEKLPGEALHELDALPGQMLHVGEDIVNGLIHGVEDMAGQLLNQVEGLAHDVEDAFTDPLAILSPSRVMYGHGADYVRGIIGGVNSQAGALKDAVHGLATGMGAPGAALPAAGASAGGSTSVHVQVPVQVQGATGDLYSSPQFQQYMQRMTQEAILRYAQLNSTNGLTPAWGR